MTNTSIDVQELSRRIGEKAKTEPHHRFWGLYTHVWKLNVLKEAYRLAKKNNGAPGVDGVTFEQIETKGLDTFLQTISDELREKKYESLPCRHVDIPKENGKVRGLKIPAIRDRVVQGALRLIMEPIFEADFGEGSYGFRPNRSPHQALDRVKEGLRVKHLYTIIDLDIERYFDTIRHHILLMKLAQRIQDDDIMWLCKRILKSGGKIGLPQGSVIGPLWANVYLNGIDQMLEKAQEASQRGNHQHIEYTRYADDLVILVSDQAQDRHWTAKVEKRLREELTKLDLKVNEEKSKVINFEVGEALDFLGYTFRLVKQKKDPRKKLVLCCPQKKKRVKMLRELKTTLRRILNIPVENVVKVIINPRIRGWVNYFKWGNPSREFRIVRFDVERKIRRFASRQRPNRRGGRSWTAWSTDTIYKTWGLYNDYRVGWCSVPGN